MASLLDTFTGRFSTQLTGQVSIPARPAQFGSWGELAPSVAAAVVKLGVARPWIHQAQAAEAIATGQHVVVATGTGSGKSLSAWIPALNIIESARASTSLASVSYRPTVLYLSPTKALAADQEHNLTRLAELVNPRIGIATIDGDADSATRAWVRDHADIVLTNPDFVHHAMLRGQQHWARLWRGLALIVVDEFHSYRGAFGANVALIVRRLLRLARHYKATPRVVFLSATSGDPEGSARRFIGEAFGPVVAVTEDGSPAGQRDIVTMQCAPLDAAESQDRRIAEDRRDEDMPEDIRRRAANTEAGETTAFLVANGARALTFVRSRPGTERVAEVAQDSLEQHAPHLAGTVAAYRGGYLPEERRELERQLRTGDLRVLATTSALELGIDISGLDAVVVTGWPGTHASFQQQIGRAGRAGGAGLGIFIGRDNPLDQYILTHPETLTTTPAEVTVFDPTNPWILPGHLCSAAAEVPLTPADVAVFSLVSTEMFDALVEADLLRERPAGWYVNPAIHVSPHSMIDIRGGGNTVSIVDEHGALLGTVDEARRDTTVHPGAIYLHQGIPYKVDSLEGDVALVHSHRDEEIRTYPREESAVEILETLETREFDAGTWNYGRVVVSSRVVGYDVRRVRDGLHLGTVPLTMPMHEMETSGVWFTMSERATRDAGVKPVDLPGALHAAEHTMIALLPLFATCDRWDIGGLSTALHLQTGMPTVIVHDAMSGGSGAAKRGFDAGLTWLRATLDTLTSCPCTDGCPRCVQSPKCGNNNHPLSKADARQLLHYLISSFSVQP